MDYNDVLVFARIVEGGGFTAAARALGVPKSSVSRSLARLERDLGVRLLQRTTRSVSLTDAGQHFFEYSRGALASLDAAAEAVREFGGEPRGTVRLTAPQDAFAMGLPEIISEFCARHPAIQVESTLTSRIVDLVGEGFDLAIRAGRLADSTLVARKIGSSDLLLFASADYLVRRGRPQSVSDLSAHDCVLFRAKNHRSTWQLTGPDGEIRVTVTGRVAADDWLFLARAASAGAGIALLPLPSVHDVVRHGALEAVLPEYRVTGSSLHLVLPSSVLVPSRVALLRDHVAEGLAARFTAIERACAGR